MCSQKWAIMREDSWFQAKWSILWPHSWHSLFKWSHIVHKGASWNSKQCCQREFSFSLHGKFIFHFSSAQKEVFLWRNYQIIVAKLNLINFIKYQAIFNAQLTKWFGEKMFWSTSCEKDKLSLIQVETGQIWNAAASYFALYFFQKSFLGK